MKSKKKVQPQPQPHELLEWLGKMPAEFSNYGGEISIPVTITLDTCAWLVYSRAAKVRGESLETTLSMLLHSEDMHFEEQGYLTDPEYHDQQAKLQKEKGGAK